MLSSLDIIMPVYNEHDYLELVLARIQRADSAGLAKRLIIIDDCSNDGSEGFIAALAGKIALDGMEGCFDAPIKVITHQHNMGKGAAVRSGLVAATADVVLIQDADLEYDPADYPALLEPIVGRRAKVVYGSRFLTGRPTKLYLWCANRLLTMVANILLGTRLTDMETCYKVFERDVLAGVALQSCGFDIEPEITAKIACQGHRIVEVPVSYQGRRAWQGKKIRWIDGIKALAALFRYRFIR